MTLDELNEKLTQNSIDTSDWWSSGKKDIQSLLDELNKWRCELEVIDWVLTRIISLVWVDIYHTDNNDLKYNLREIKQVLKNGTEVINDFDHSVWLKMEGTETPITAMRRWMREILKLKWFVDIKKWTKNRINKTSKSYPGLASQYIRYWFSAKLNNDQFNPDWYIDKQKDKTFYFEWNRVEKSEEEK